MDVELDEFQLIVNNISKLTINSIRGGGGGVMTSAIADGGSNTILFPKGYPGTTNFKSIPMSACLADGNSQLQIYGTAMYGIFQVMIADVQRPIWSECSLVLPPIQFSIFKQNRDMYIVKVQGTKTTMITTCTLMPEDDLYHFDQLEDLLAYETSSSITTTAVTSNVNTVHLTESQLHLKGSQQHVYKATYGKLNELEILHVLLGHLSERAIKYLVKNAKTLNVKGLKFTYDKIKLLKLRMCRTCMISRMHAFPVYASISNKVYQPMQVISCDILIMEAKPDLRGRKYAIIFADKLSGCPFPYFTHRKTELLDCLKRFIRNHGKNRNPMAVDIKVINADSGAEQLDTTFLNHCDELNILFNLAPPKKPQYDYVESLMRGIKTGTKANLIYNEAPLTLWSYAMRAWCYIYRQLPKVGAKAARVTIFNGSIPDFSSAVPFYAKGFCNITKEERDRGVLPGNAWPCRMLGYAVEIDSYDTPQVGINSAPGIVNYKDSYIIRLESGVILIRHDCYFNVHNDTTDPLHPNPRNDLQKDADDDALLERLLPTDTSLRLEGIRTRLQQQILEREASTLERHQMQVEDNRSDNHRFALEASSYSNPDPIGDYYSADVSSNDDANPYWHPAANLALRCLPDRRVQYDNPNHPFTSNKVAVCAAVRFKKHANLDFPSLDDIGSVEPDTADWVDHTPTSPIPQSTLEAFKSTDKIYWRSAMIRELQKLLQRHTWTSYSLPEQHLRLKNAVKSKFSAYKAKTRAEDALRKFKARLTAMGFTQVLGINYTDTYAPTSKFETICVILFLATIFNWDLNGLDIENAFIEGILDEEIDMVLPEELFRNSDGTPVVVRLLKAIYGLKQASHVFYILMKTALATVAMHPSPYDPCLFIHIDDSTQLITVVVLWVDDIVVTGNNAPMREAVIKSLEDVVTKVVYEGEVKRYIGIDITRDRVNRTMKLSQHDYRKSLTDKYLQPSTLPKSTPVNSQTDLNKAGDGSIAPIYAQAGELGYIAERTAPEIKFPTSQFRSNASKPSDDHITNLNHMFKYLKEDLDSGITYSATDPNEVLLFVVADGSKIRDGDSRGQISYACFLNLVSGTIFARSVKNGTIATSPASEELLAIVLAAKKIIWLRGLLASLGFNQHEPTKLFTDSTAAMDMISNHKTSNKSEHLTLQINFVRQLIDNATIQLVHVDTDLNVADLMTKNLARGKFIPHKATLLHGHGGKHPSSKVPKRIAVPNPFTKVKALRRKADRARETTVRFLDKADTNAA
mgnify:CR=1 FL=1